MQSEVATDSAFLYRHRVSVATGLQVVTECIGFRATEFRSEVNCRHLAGATRGVGTF